MNDIKVNHKLVLYPSTSSTSGYSNSSNNKGNNKNNCSSQSFQDILMQKLENQLRPLSEAPKNTIQPILTRRPLYIG